MDLEGPLLKMVFTMKVIMLMGKDMEKGFRPTSKEVNIRDHLRTMSEMDMESWSIIVFVISKLLMRETGLMGSKKVKEN